MNRLNEKWEWNAKRYRPPLFRVIINWRHEIRIIVCIGMVFAEHDDNCKPVYTFQTSGPS